MTELRSEFPQHYNIYRIPGDVIEKNRQHPLLVNLFLLSTGHMREALGHYVERDTIDTYLIIYCVAGRGWFRSNDTSWDVTRGDIVLVPRDTPHAYGADRDQPWTIQWAHFSGGATEALLKLANITPEQPVISIGERLNIVSLFDEILRTLQAGYNLHYLINAAAYLRQILSNIALLNTYSPPISSEDLNAEKIIHFMLDNLTNANIRLMV